MGNRLAFFGDLQLGTALRLMVPSWQRQGAQVYGGVDRTYSLATANSPSWLLELEVVSFWAPETDYSKKGFRAREMAVSSALQARSEAAHPVVWVENSSNSKTVGSVVGATITSNAHGFSNGDRVLIRRNGVGLYTLGSVSSVATDTFVITAILGSHTILAGDNIHLVEEYYGSCITRGMGALRPTTNDYYSEEVSFPFYSSGSATYARTSITLP